MSGRGGLIALLILYVGLNSTAVLLLRASLDGAQGIRVLVEPRVIVGGALYASSFVVWLLALRSFQVTSVYPLFLGAGFVGVTLGARLLLGESVTATKAAGMLVILAGVLVVVRA